MTIDDALVTIKTNNDAMQVAFNWQDAKYGFPAQFFASYTCFTTGPELFAVFIAQYHIPTDPYPATRFLHHTFRKWSKASVKNIKQAVCSVLTWWGQKYGGFDSDDMQALAKPFIEVVQEDKVGMHV